MLSKLVIPIIHLFLIVLMAIMATPPVWATGPPCCQPSNAVFYSEFFGYYPTCWRQWPGGQPLCPGQHPPAKTTLRKEDRSLELLPAPLPEPPPPK
jgi:hypothetical protein